MNVFGTYFGWIFSIIAIVLFFVLSKALLMESIPATKKWFSEKQLEATIVSLFVLAIILFLTFNTAWHACKEIFPGFGDTYRIREIWYPGNRSFWELRWSERAQFAFISATFFSLLCLLVLGVHRIHRWVKGQSTGSQTILDGRSGRMLQIIVVSLSVVSSIVTIVTAFAP